LPIRYTQHAIWQMHRRQISPQAVEAVLQGYHTSRPAPHRDGSLPAVIYTGEFQGRDLKVYVARDSNPTLVTTAVWEGD
jgi:hypothetical protein